MYWVYNQRRTSCKSEARNTQFTVFYFGQKRKSRIGFCAFKI